MLMMTPALKEVAKKGTLDLMIPINFKDLFLNLDFIDSLMGSDSMVDKSQYDKVFDLTDYEFNYEQIHQPLINKTKIEIFKDALNISGGEENIQINLSDEEGMWANLFIKKHKLRKGKIILLAIKSANITRDWELEKWKLLIDRLKKLNFDLVIIDKEMNWEDEEVTFFNNHSIRELFSLVSISDMVLCHDSGILHIGGAFEKKTLGIFGPTDPKMRCVYKNSYWVDNGMDIPFSWYDRRDSKDYFDAISVGDVEREFLEVINNE